MRTAFLLLGSGLATLLFTGCTTLVGSFTAVSSKNVNISSLRLDQSMLKGHGVGEDCQDIILFIPDKGPPNIKEAMDRALESQKGNVLLNARITRLNYSALVYGQNCFTVEGDVYDTYK